MRVGREMMMKQAGNERVIARSRYRTLRYDSPELMGSKPNELVPGFCNRK